MGELTAARTMAFLASLVVNLALERSVIGQARSVNLDGFVRGHGWNLFFPILEGIDCDDGGKSNLDLSRLAPQEIGAEEPKSGDI